MNPAKLKSLKRRAPIKRCSVRLSRVRSCSPEIHGRPAESRQASGNITARHDKEFLA
jgi:hypothetical protein